MSDADWREDEELALLVKKRIDRGGPRTSGAQFLRDLSFDDLGEEVEQVSLYRGHAADRACSRSGAPKADA